MVKEKKKSQSKNKGREDKPSIKEQIKKENRQLRDILAFIGLLIFIFAAIMFINYKVSNFENEGVKYKVINEGNLIFYNTFFKVYQNGQPISNYNFYIRNDPRKLSEEVPFEGDYVLLKNMVLDSDSEFKCDGDGIIAVANFINVHKFFGSEVIKNNETKCDDSGRYNYILLKEGNETKIEETGRGCYEISINNCEILEGTERFIIETFSVANENLK